MDPNACLHLILDSLASSHEDSDREEVVEALRNLATWLEQYGFLPDVTCRREGSTSRNDYGTWDIGN